MLGMDWTVAVVRSRATSDRWAAPPGASSRVRVGGRPYSRGARAGSPVPPGVVCAGITSRTRDGGREFSACPHVPAVRGRALSLLRGRSPATRAGRSSYLPSPSGARAGRLVRPICGASGPVSVGPPVAGSVLPVDRLDRQAGLRLHRDRRHHRYPGPHLRARFRRRRRPEGCSRRSPLPVPGVRRRSAPRDSDPCRKLSSSPALSDVRAPGGGVPILWRCCMYSPVRRRPQRVLIAVPALARPSLTGGSSRV